MEVNSGQVGIVVLAAGRGTRMRSDKAKVLHEILGKPMILYATETAVEVAGDDVVVVVGHHGDKVREVVTDQYKVKFANQTEQLGTGHAVKCGLPEIATSVEQVVIMYGDSPLISPSTIRNLLETHLAEQKDITILAVILSDPTGYGRILQNTAGEVIGIVEEADADYAQKEIEMVNSGIYCVERAFLEWAITQITSENQQNEFYLTDILEIGHQNGKRLGVVVGEFPEEASGVNSLSDLRRVEGLMRKQCSQQMEN